MAGKRIRIGRLDTAGGIAYEHGYKGRKPTARAKGSEVKRLRLDGIGPSAIAKRLGISRASVYRALA